MNAPWVDERTREVISPRFRKDRGEEKDRAFQFERSEASPLLIARTCSSYSLFVARRVVSGPSGRTIGGEEEEEEEERNRRVKKGGKEGRKTREREMGRKEMGEEMGKRTYPLSGGALSHLSEKQRHPHLVRSS